jgi:hypothetical protein
MLYASENCIDIIEDEWRGDSSEKFIGDYVNPSE